MVAIPAAALEGRDVGGIKAAKLSIGGVVCYGFNDHALTLLCKKTGLQKRSIKKSATDYEGVQLVSSKELIFKKNRSVNGAARPLTKELYLDLCGKDGRAERIKELQKRRDAHKRQVEDTQQKLVALIRECNEITADLERLESDNSSLLQHGQEFDRLLEHPDLERVEISGHRLIVYTKPIYVDYDRATYKIGRFKIQIHTDGGEGCVTMRNLDHRVEGAYDHPHVQVGAPCLGNISKVLPSLIGERKFPAAIAVCIRYLQSYTYSDAYKPYRQISHWPCGKKPQERKEKV